MFAVSARRQFSGRGQSPSSVKNATQATSKGFAGSTAPCPNAHAQSSEARSAGSLRLDPLPARAVSLRLRSSLRRRFVRLGPALSQHAEEILLCFQLGPRNKGDEVCIVDMSAFEAFHVVMPERRRNGDWKKAPLDEEAVHGKAGDAAVAVRKGVDKRKLLVELGNCDHGMACDKQLLLVPDQILHRYRNVLEMRRHVL